MYTLPEYLATIAGAALLCGSLYNVLAANRTNEAYRKATQRVRHVGLTSVAAGVKQGRR